MSVRNSCLVDVPLELFFETYSFLGANNIKTHAKMCQVSKATRDVMYQDRVVKYHMSTIFPKEYAECISDVIPNGEWHYLYRINGKFQSLENRCTVITRNQQEEARWILMRNKHMSIGQDVCSVFTWVGLTVTSLSVFLATLKSQV